MLPIGVETALAQAASPRGGNLTCSGPVSNKDTGESLYSQYGEDASLNSFNDRGNNSFIEVDLFSAEALLIARFENNDFVKPVAAIEIGWNATAWWMAGLKVGMSLEEVAAINGKPFTLEMTNYDLIANVGFSDGRLAKLDGGCRLRVEFMIGNDIKIPDSINFSKVSSDHPELVKTHPTVSKLTLIWSGK